MIYIGSLLGYSMKNGRNTTGKFTSGNSVRPKGVRNKNTLAVESLLEGQAEALTQTAISRDSMALWLYMERIAPAPKDNPVSFNLSVDIMRMRSSICGRLLSARKFVTSLY